MRISAVLLVLLSLVACNRGIKSNDAVRQGVIDYLTSKTSVSVTGMDVNVTAVQFNGDKAEATVSFTPKGGNAAQGMTMKYQLEQQGNKWVVVSRADSAGHGATTLPTAPEGNSPHGQGVVPGGASPKMPSPEDLPPAKK